jgi:hypothetical protein
MVVSLITVYKSGQTVRLEIDAVVEHTFKVRGVDFQVVRITEYIDHKLTPVQVAKDGLCCYPVGQEFSDPDLDLCEFLEKAETFSEAELLLEIRKWEQRAAAYPLELPGFD